MMGGETLHGDVAEADGEATAPVWPVFADLMSGLLGAFVLILLCVLAAQFELSARLDQEVQQRQQEAQRRQALEQALAGPLAAGRVTLDHGKIGISGSVLFAFNSDDLQPEGRQLLKSLASPLAAYLKARNEVLMVSGFTDDRQVRGGNHQFADNWELSAQRALTVTRALIDEGVPASNIFAAAFGAQQPVASNADAEGRARNRRVEMAPMPRPSLNGSGNADGAEAAASAAALGTAASAVAASASTANPRP
jgi:outer membrane protein OmpA-like peptidoglycan-associated protein